MHKKRHINIFDFDETLFRVPNFSTIEAKDKSPYEWYDSKDSLSDHLPIRGILNSINKAREPESINYLVTHRVPHLSEQIEYWSNEFRLNFKNSFFLGRESSKYEPILEILSDNPNVDTISIYEDSLNQIIEYTNGLRFIQKIKNLNIEFHYIDTSREIIIPWNTAILLSSNCEIIKLNII
jgi:hypothetical protein